MMQVPEVLPLSREEMVAWDVYFAGVVSLQYHPANEAPADLDACADVVARMIDVRRRRTLCLGS